MTPLTRDEIEFGLDRWDRRHDRRGAIERWEIWTNENGGRLLQMALDSLPKEETQSKPHEFMVNWRFQDQCLICGEPLAHTSHLTDAFVALRSSATDSPKEPTYKETVEGLLRVAVDNCLSKPTTEKACCGNCKHWGSLTNYCEVHNSFNVEKTLLCDAHERKPDANT